MVDKEHTEPQEFPNHEANVTHLRLKPPGAAARTRKTRALSVRGLQDPVTARKEGLEELLRDDASRPGTVTDITTKLRQQEPPEK